MHLNKQLWYVFVFTNMIYAVDIQATCNSFTANLAIDTQSDHQKKVYLVVDVAENFKKMQNSTCSLQTFISSDEQEDDWSKMIIIETILGQKTIADDCMKQIKEGINKIDKRAVVMTDVMQCKKPYSLRKLIVKYYNLYTQREEILLARYFSSDHECAGFQYIVAIREGFDADAAMQELERFEKENARIEVY